MCVLFLSPHNGDAAGAQTRWQSCWRLQQLALVQVVESLLVFWALLGLAWPYWALFGLTVPSWALLDLTKCFKRLFSIWVWGLTDIVQSDLCAFAYFFFEFYTLWIHLMLFDLFIQYVAMFNILEAPSYLQIQIQIQSLLIYIFLSNLSTLEHPSHQRNKVLEGSLLCMVTCLDLKYKFKIKT